MRGRVLGIVVALFTFLATLHAAPLDVAGAWKLNRDLTSVPEPGPEGRPPGSHRSGGGRGGGGRGGGFGGLGGGRGGGMGQPNEGDMHKMDVVRRRLTEIADRLIIVHSGDSVAITDGNGRHLSFKADGKKQQQVTGDGEFKTKTHFEGANLIIEEDFGGPKVTTTYAPILEGGEILRLEVTLRIEGGHEGEMRGGSAGGRPGGPGGPPPLKRVYDSEGR